MAMPIVLHAHHGAERIKLNTNLDEILATDPAIRQQSRFAESESSIRSLLQDERANLFVVHTNTQLNIELIEVTPPCSLLAPSARTLEFDPEQLLADESLGTVEFDVNTLCLTRIDACVSYEHSWREATAQQAKIISIGVPGYYDFVFD